MKKRIRWSILILAIVGSIIAGFIIDNQNNQNKKVEEKQEEKIESIYANLHLNMRLMPLDRGYFFEDPINEYLLDNEVGEVTGGGTALNEDGMPTSCDVEIYINTQKKQELIDYIKSLPNIAKGSYLEIENEVIEVGTIEGLNIMLNGTELPSNIYKENDINDVIEDMNNLLGTQGEFYSYYYGEQYTNLYFYGKSYEEMKKTIEEYSKKCPLCQKSIIEKI